MTTSTLFIFYYSHKQNLNDDFLIEFITFFLFNKLLVYLIYILSFSYKFFPMPAAGRLNYALNKLETVNDSYFI